MNTQRGSDDEEQTRLQQQGKKLAEELPSRSSDIAEELTIKLGEEALPVSPRPSAPASSRPPEITNAPTAHLGGASSPEPEPPQRKAALSSDAVRPMQPPPASVAPAKGASGAPRSRWGVPPE